jgi:glycosyltransferase involved in cell wall biosynthesis
MAQILVLTSDLPFFPGRNGHDFFNLRNLARNNQVGVVAPRYPSYPADGVANLAKAIQHVYLWPDAVPAVPLFVSSDPRGALPRWVHRLPKWFRRGFVLRRLGIAGQPDDAYERLAILANCAPYLLRALQERHWQAIVLIQTSLAPWLEFLPDVGAKVIYFHDVRSNYLARSPDPLVAKTARQVRQQELLVCARAEAAGFVSALDLDRAERTLALPATRLVAPIPVDLDYFTPRPDSWRKDPRKIVLFTGHLRHPPNVDAVLYFLQSVWPLVRKALPEAVFVIAGRSPDPKLELAAAASANTELHADVPDIRPYFWNADAYVVPMRYGGGVRQKIFEAWAMGVPVVSTTMGAEGTGAADGINCALQDGAEQIAGGLLTILRNGPDDRVMRAAADLALRDNSIPAAAGAFEKLVHSGIARRRERPFKLLFDLRWMEIGKSGGVEQMTHELLHHVSHLDQVNHYRMYVPRSTYHEWDFDPGFSCRPYFSDAGASRLEGLDANLTNQIAESLGLPAVLSTPMRTLRAWRKMDFDLVHSLIGYLHPDLEAFPHVVTVHDLQHLTYPQFFPADEWKTREHLYRESARRAAHIIAISEFTRQDIHQRYAVPLDKITTIWNIPSRNAWMPLSDEKCRELLRRLGVAGPFLFFPAHCWPHKNHARLIEAFALILPHLRKEVKLVLTGRPFPDDHPARLLIEQHGLQDRVVHLGYRSPLEMKALFHSCLLLVFPSLFEGFGMPVAEAIIAGKPVACSNTTSLPEIAGDAALTFDPENIHDIGGRLLEIINDPVRREILANAARRRRPVFSARMSAIKTISLYRRVHEAVYQD